MTEDVNPEFEGFDQWSTLRAIEAMYEGQIMALTAMKPALSAISVAAKFAAKRLGDDGRLVYVGAGTSGRIAVQDGAELGPTFGWPQERTLFCMAGGLEALTISAEGAEDVFAQGVSAMQTENVGENDVVFGVAASGRTPFTIGALQEANERGALTIGIANNPNTPLLCEAAHGILVETGSEIIAGSTRMKAGTAQKAVLNMLSTAIMTRLGRVYKGLMVNMIVSNKKLERRAVNMVCNISGCEEDLAVAALEKTDQNIKAAVLVALGQSLQNSVHILDAADNNLRKALALINHV